jgi:hypothetical protein
MWVLSCRIISTKQEDFWWKILHNIMKVWTVGHLPDWNIIDLIAIVHIIACKSAGVEQVKTDQYNHRVTVTGFVDPIRVLKRVKKIKRRSDFVPWRMHYQHSSYEGAKSYPQYPQSSQVHMTQQYYPDNYEAYYAHELNYPYSFYAPSYHHHYWAWFCRWKICIIWSYLIDSYILFVARMW